VWGCSSTLQSEILAQNVKKKFWSIWKKFKKRKYRDKFLSKEKHFLKKIKKKERIYYNFLKEKEFCGFNRFSQLLETLNKKDPIQE
jgi:hypothetical protein